MTGIPDPGGVSGTFAALDRAPAADEPMEFRFAEGALPIRGWLVDGNPWFSASDIAGALDYRMASDMTRRLDDDEKGTRSVRTPGGLQNVSIISESGLYTAILGSRIPGAVDFKRWVTREVLPTLRRTGSYFTAPALKGPELVAAALIEAHAMLTAKDERIAELEPKAEFYDELMDADGAYTWNATAKILGWGRNVMLKELRKLGVVQGNRLPYQRYAHYFKVVPGTYQHPQTGEQIPYATTYVLPSGIEFLRKKLAGVLV